MALSQQKRAFGVFCNHRQLEGALRELKLEGFPMSQVCAINKQIERESVQARHELRSTAVSYGIPEEQATVYGDRISRGEYFVIVDGTEDEVCQALGILNRWNIRELRIYDAVTH